MKTTTDLPDELIREVKLRAVMQRRTVKDLVAELLRQALGMAPSGRPEMPSASSLVQIRDRGLPVIRCIPDAPATHMNVTELLKLEKATQAEEDSKRAGISI